MEPVTSEAIRVFLQRLSERYAGRGVFYLLGGGALLLLGSSRETRDVDYMVELEPGAEAEFQSALDALATESQLDLESVPLAEFIPLPPQTRERRRLIGRYGQLEVYVFDLYSIALSKIARGFEADLEDKDVGVERWNGWFPQNPVNSDQSSVASHQSPNPFKWDEERRAALRAELDACYARLYGLTRKQLRYILDPHGLSRRELEDLLDPWEEPTCSGPHLLPANPAVDFPGETFRVLKQKEERLYGDASQSDEKVGPRSGWRRGGGMCCCRCRGVFSPGRSPDSPTRMASPAPDHH